MLCYDMSVCLSVCMYVCMYSTHTSNIFWANSGNFFFGFVICLGFLVLVAIRDC